MTTGGNQPAFQPPVPIDWRDLIAAGRATLIPQPPATLPAQAAIRRAISTAYYAAFHALTASNADVLVGPARDQQTANAWVRTYRNLNHNQAKTQLQQHRNSLSTDAQVFADLFRDLQNERHNADYNPATSFTHQTAINWLNKAEAAITDFLLTSQSERAAIAIFTLTRDR